MGRCRSKLSASAVIGAVALALTACGGDDKTGAVGSQSASGGGRSLACQDGKLRIGIAKAQSGFASFFDTAGTRGLQIAIEQVNAAGGIKGCKIETVIRDTKSDPAVGAAEARKLIEDGVQILFVADDLDTGIAAARVGQKAGVLTLSAAASTTQFAKAVGDKFFSAGITTTELGSAQAKYALERKWKTTFQAIDPGLAYFTEQDEVYRSLYEPKGGRVIGADKVDSLGGQTDFSAVISKIESAKPDVVQALMVYPAVGTFVKQLRAAGVDTPVVGNVTLDTRELQSLAGKEGLHDVAYAVQVYFNGAGRDPETDPEIAKFTEQYEQKFGHFPEQANAPEAFQMFNAVAKALQQRQVKDAASAAEAIRAQKNVDVPGGTLVRWQDGYAVWNPVIVGFDDAGEFRQVTTYKADAEE